MRFWVQLFLSCAGAWFLSASEGNDTKCRTGQFRSESSCTDCLNHCIACSSIDMCSECEDQWYGPVCQQKCSRCEDKKCSKTGCEVRCKDGFISANYEVYNASFGTWCKGCDELWPSCFSCTPDRCLRCLFRKWGPQCTQVCLQTCKDKTCAIDTGKCDRQCQEGHCRNVIGKCERCPVACQNCSAAVNSSSCSEGHCGASSQSGNIWWKPLVISISVVVFVCAIIVVLLVYFIQRGHFQTCCPSVLRQYRQAPREDNQARSTEEEETCV